MLVSAIWDTPPRSCPGRAYPCHGDAQEVEGPSEEGTRHREWAQEVHRTSRMSPVTFYNHPGSIRALTTSWGDTNFEISKNDISCTPGQDLQLKSKMTAYIDIVLSFVDKDWSKSMR